METLVALTEERAQIVKEMRGIANKQQIDPKDAHLFDGYKERLDEIDAGLARIRATDEAEKRFQTVATERRDFGALNDDSYISNAIQMKTGATDSRKDYGKTREIMQEYEHRDGPTSGFRVPYSALFTRAADISTTLPTGGNGGNLVSTDFREDMYVDRLRDSSTLGMLGATFMTGLYGDVTIPVNRAGTTATWVNEDAVIPSSGMQTGQINMTPRHVAAKTQLSRNMLLQTMAETIVRNDLRMQLDAAMLNAALNGSGSNGEPLGIMNIDGIGTYSTGTNGAALTWENIQSMEGVADDAFATPTAWLTNSKVIRKLRSTTKTTDGETFIADSRTVLDGLPLFSSSRVGASFSKGTGTNLSALILADWRDLLVGQWGNSIEILVNPYESDAYSRGGIAIRAIATIDITVRHKESFVICKDVKTA